VGGGACTSLAVRAGALSLNAGRDLPTPGTYGLGSANRPKHHPRQAQHVLRCDAQARPLHHPLAQHSTPGDPSSILQPEPLLGKLYEEWPQPSQVWANTRTRSSHAIAIQGKIRSWGEGQRVEEWHKHGMQEIEKGHTWGHWGDEHSAAGLSQV
jgi:hypothetical protein